MSPSCTIVRHLILPVLALLALLAPGASAEVQSPAATLRIWSATDTAAMTGIIAGFKARYPAGCMLFHLV